MMLSDLKFIVAFAIIHCICAYASTLRHTSKASIGYQTISNFKQNSTTMVSNIQKDVITTITSILTPSTNPTHTPYLTGHVVSYSQVQGYATMNIAIPSLNISQCKDQCSGN